MPPSDKHDETLLGRGKCGRVVRIMTLDVNLVCSFYVYMYIAILMQNVKCYFTYVCIFIIYLYTHMYTYSGRYSEVRVALRKPFTLPTYSSYVAYITSSTRPNLTQSDLNAIPPPFGYDRGTSVVYPNTCTRPNSRLDEEVLNSGGFGAGPLNSGGFEQHSSSGIIHGHHIYNHPDSCALKLVAKEVFWVRVLL